mgnify:CR=1 FL=1
MSKIFLEFNEITENKNPKSFKIEVKDKEEAFKKILSEEPNWLGLKYKKIIHKCRHIDTGEKTNQPCSVSEL